MTHEPEFAAALDAVTPLLGAPTEVKQLATCAMSFASWARDGFSWEMDNAQMGVILAVMRGDRVVREDSIDGPDYAASAAAAVERLRAALVEVSP